MERCKGCVFFDGISFCHYHECECPYILIFNDYEKDDEDIYISSIPDCFSEGDLE